MQIDVLTLFPAMFQGPLTESILQRAREEGLLQIDVHDLRRWGLGKYKQVDDSPYGGGAGMVMRADVLAAAIEAVSEMDFVVGTSRRDVRTTHARSDARRDVRTTHAFAHSRRGVPWRIAFTPRGRRLTQSRVEQLAKKERLLLVCGHYEGIDQRVMEGWIDEEVSIGDYVLTGGELPAMVLIDAVSRQIPGVLGKEESVAEESFSKALGRKKEYPHYTRPEDFRSRKVPPVLLSGNHKEIEKWRRERLG